MSPQLKSIWITESDKIELREQVIFQNGQEGKRVWESGITISRYIKLNQEQFINKTVLDLGSGTGIGGIAVMKFTEAKKVIMTDYTEEILDLLQGNLKLQPKKVPYELQLVDWTLNETYNRVLDQAIDIVLATDVIYKGSPYDSLSQLLKTLATQFPEIKILIIIPKQRDCRDDFLRKMSEHGFEWNIQ